MIARVRQWWSTSHQLPLYSQHVRQGLLIASAPAARTHLSPLCDRHTCACGGARCIIPCCTRNTCAKGGAHHTSSCRDCSNCFCGGVLRTVCCGDRSICACDEARRSYGERSTCIRDVAASHTQTAVAAAETLRRHTRRLLLRQQRR